MNAIRFTMGACTVILLGVALLDAFGYAAGAGPLPRGMRLVELTEPIPGVWSVTATPGLAIALLAPGVAMGVTAGGVLVLLTPTRRRR